MGWSRMHIKRRSTAVSLISVITVVSGLEFGLASYGWPFRLGFLEDLLAQERQPLVSEQCDVVIVF